MQKVSFVLTHDLNPRLFRRIKTFVKNGFYVDLIYGNREYQNKKKVEIEGCNNITEVPFSNSGSSINRSYNLLLFSKKIANFLNDTKPEIIYVSGFDALMTVYSSGWHNKAILLYEVPDLAGGRWREKMFFRHIIDFMERRMLKYVDKIILTFPYYIDCNHKKHKLKIFVFENVPEKRIFRNYQKIRHENFVVGFFGGVRYKRPMETLVKGLGGLEGIEIVIAGDGKYYNEIEIMSSQYTNIKMLGSYNYEKDIINLYSMVDCIYSVYDPELDNVRVALPNKLYEAIVCGLPLIASKGTKLGEYIVENGFGFAVSPYDPDDLKEVVLNLAGNQKLIQKISDRCKAVRNKYFYESVEESFMKQIKQLLNEHY